MISKTGMLALIKALRWKEVAAGLTEKPELIEFRDERGRNWLHLCCMVDPKRRKLRPAASVKTAEVLLNAGLDVNQEAFREGGWKATPLWHAVARGENLALAEFLLERGSAPNHCLWGAVGRDNPAAIKLLISRGADVDPVAEDETPFLAAVKSSRFGAARTLLDHGADVDFQDSRGMTALHYMLEKDSEERHFRMLVRYDPRGDLPDRDGGTAAQIMGRKRSASFRRMASRLLVPRSTPQSPG